MSTGCPQRWTASVRLCLGKFQINYFTDQSCWPKQIRPHTQKTPNTASSPGMSRIQCNLWWSLVQDLLENLIWPVSHYCSSSDVPAHLAEAKAHVMFLWACYFFPLWPHRNWLLGRRPPFSRASCLNQEKRGTVDIHFCLCGKVHALLTWVSFLTLQMIHKV